MEVRTSIGKKKKTEIYFFLFLSFLVLFFSVLLLLLLFFRVEFWTEPPHVEVRTSMLLNPGTF